MAGPKTTRILGNGGVEIREAEYAGAPLRVSDEAKPRNVSTPKSARNIHQNPQPYAAISDRPSTAGGVSSRRPIIENPGTKDDIHVSPLRANPFGTTYYNFPLPASLPTPAATPGTSPSRAYTAGTLESGLIGSSCTQTYMEIGMALGSPTQQTSTWSPHVQFQAPVREYSPESLEEWQTTTATPKRKPSKWKKWGGLFGRKSSDSSVEFSQANKDVQIVNETDYLTFPDPPMETTRSRARTNSEKKIGKHKPDIQRAHTIPMNFQFQESREAELPKGPKQFPVLKEIQPPQIKVDGGHLLNVDIPTIEMERYSVMFGSVIKPNSSASSLLARRQATLDKLKVVNEAIAQHERQEAEAKSKLLRTRRATSPQPTRSPAMSLFPIPPRTQRDGSSHIPYRASPLHRSNTSPAALSPNRQTFEPLRPDEEEHTIMLALTPTLQPTATLKGPWSTDNSLFALESPNSMISIEEVHDSAPLKPRLSEPKWEMISPRTIVEEPMKVKPLKLASKPNIQSHGKHSLQSSLDALARVGANEEAEELLRTAADVSIARQISMSRQQRQLLTPINSNSVGAGPLLPPKDGYTGMDRLLVNEKKKMTPRLVNVQARRVVKSERVVFDQA